MKIEKSWCIAAIMLVLFACNVSSVQGQENHNELLYSPRARIFYFTFGAPKLGDESEPLEGAQMCLESRSSNLVKRLTEIVSLDTEQVAKLELTLALESKKRLKEIRGIIIEVDKEGKSVEDWIASANKLTQILNAEFPGEDTLPLKVLWQSLSRQQRLIFFRHEMAACGKLWGEPFPLSEERVAKIIGQIPEEAMLSELPSYRRFAQLLANTESLAD